MECLRLFCLLFKKCLIQNSQGIFVILLYFDCLRFFLALLQIPWLKIHLGHSLFHNFDCLIGLFLSPWQKPWFRIHMAHSLYNIHRTVVIFSVLFSKVHDPGFSLCIRYSTFLTLTEAFSARWQIPWFRTNMVHLLINIIIADWGFFAFWQFLYSENLHLLFQNTLTLSHKPAISSI